MWIAKVKLSGEKAVLGCRTKKYNINGTGYPISIHKKKDGIYVVSAGLMFGEEKNKKRFINNLKKAKKLLKLEVKNDFLIGLIKEPLEVEPLYSPFIIHIKPIFFFNDGSEVWEVGSWNKKELMKFINVAKKKYNGRLLKIKEEKVSNISILSINPELTNKQKKALELAIKNGYYEYPRKIKLEKLAKTMGLSYSTYQAHLRKAEQKLMPSFFERSK